MWSFLLPIPQATNPDHVLGEMAANEERLKALKGAQPLWHKVALLEGEIRGLGAKWVGEDIAGGDNRQVFL